MYNFKQKCLIRWESEGNINYLEEFIRFIRPKICLFITGIAVTGYLLFNPINTTFFYVAFSSFFAAVAVYTFNQFTDKQEDLLNKKRLNFFILNNHALTIIFCFLFLSIVPAFFLSTKSLIIYISWIIIGMSYSIFRIKEIFPLKNIYTALFMPLGFLVGALSNSEFTLEIAKVFLTIVVLVFVVSLIGDLRDFKGDKSAGIPTVAVVLGYELTKKIALFCLLIFIGWLFYLRYIVFYSILPFVFLALFFLIKNDILKTRILILSSFMFLPIFLVLKNLLEVI